MLAQKALTCLEKCILKNGVFLKDCYHELQLDAQVSAAGRSMNRAGHKMAAPLEAPAAARKEAAKVQPAAQCPHQRRQAPGAALPRADGAGLNVSQSSVLFPSFSS